MKKWLQKNKLSVAGALIGAVAGFSYWKFVGCASGICAITSSPINSTLYFALMGFLLFNSFTPLKKQDDGQ